MLRRVGTRGDLGTEVPQQGPKESPAGELESKPKSTETTGESKTEMPKNTQS